MLNLLYKAKSGRHPTTKSVPTAINHKGFKTMVAQIFSKNSIARFEIRVVWHDITTGFVNGVRFAVVDGMVTFPNHPTFNKEYEAVKPSTRNLAINLGRAVALTPQFQAAKRESKATNLNVVNGNFPGLFQVTNPLSGSIYNVVLRPGKTFCECPDHQYRKLECKHIRVCLRYQPQIQPVAVPTLMPSYAGKARSVGRIKAAPDLDITKEQYLAISRASLGI